MTGGMVTESFVAQQGDALGVAKEGVRLGAVPDWVFSCPYRPEFRSKTPGPVTHLLVSHQIQAELRQTHIHIVMRLENMQAVQKESRWRLDFDPRHQKITLHWIKTRRGAAEFDHTDLSKARLTHQEGEASVLEDRLTLLLMLEDVRPGDILEWCYTIETQPVLLPDYCTALFTLPAGAPVGKLYFAVRFNASRPMQWKSSEKSWIPSETQEEDQLLWQWAQENYPGLRPEENTPEWHIAFPWIQISDCLDWETVAAAFAEAWPEDEKDPAIAKIAQEIGEGQGNTIQQTERAIQMVQDEYRDVLTSGELDGRPPSPLEVVARRRFGDSKDLSFFLMHLFKRLDVPARLVLVSTALRKSLGELLPTPGLFDHVLVEFQARGLTRWVDATLKRQEGGPLQQSAPDYGVGLPISTTPTHLVKTPEGSVRPSVYELNESILLDTTGAASWLGVVVAASGSHAEALRHEFENEGLEAVSRKRLRACADRFMNARRIGSLEFRDDRAANEFFIAEIFEINGFLTADTRSGWYKLEIANDWLTNFLNLPDPVARRTPFALPYPSTIVHVMEVLSVALPPAVVQQRNIDTRYLQFSRSRKTRAGYWTIKLSLTTLAGAVAPADIDEHRDALREIRSQVTFSLVVPGAEARPHQRSDFGKLPASWDSLSAVPPPPRPLPKNRDIPAEPDPSAPAATVASAAGAPILQPPGPRMKRRKRHRRKREQKKIAIWKVIVLLGSLVALALFFLAVARHASYPPIPESAPAPQGGGP